VKVVVVIYVMWTWSTVRLVLFVVLYSNCSCLHCVQRMLILSLSDQFL